MAKTTEPIRETIKLCSMDEVMHQSMMPYAEHIILERALPRVEDGLKPVQRRILYTMMELGLDPDKPHRKCARIVGDCLGKYHPHGDSSVYEAMVRMAQPFNMRVCLVDGHGNFGSVDGDGAAAMRYTEARMTGAATRLLMDIEKDTVDHANNFDDTLKEPVLLPGRFPNLLINGTSGIAIGLATNIPPHNPREAIDAVIAVMEDPSITLDELMKIIPAPDFPTGGYLLRSDEIRLAYETGRGKLVMRAKTHFEPQKNGKTYIVITEMPYQVNKASALEKIYAVTQEKKALFAGVGDIRDESDRTGMRAVIEVKKDYDTEKILRYLFKYSDLQMTFGVNMVAIAGGKPQQMGLKELINHYIRHQRDVVTRRTKYELEQAEKREHVLAGLMIAVNNLDRVIALIRGSKSPKEAKTGLMQEFGLTDVQAQAILDLRLQRLTNLELLAIEKEHADVLKLIDTLRGILSSDKKLIALIKKELLAIREEIGDDRLTQLIDGDADIRVTAEELTVAEDITVAVLADGRARRMSRKAWAAFTLPEDEKVAFLLDTQSNKRVRFFTDTGAMHTLQADEIPETRSNAKPVNLASLLAFEGEENIIALCPDETDGEYLFYTRDGMVKRSAAEEYKLRVKRTAAVSLRDGDKVIGIEKVSGEADMDSILMVSRKGMSIRFETASVPQTGRVSGGVRCMKLDDGDAVCYAEQVGDEGELLVITDRGYGKRTFLFDYEIQGRNGKGVRTFEFKKNGSNGAYIVAAFAVKEPFPLTVTQRHGTVTVIDTETVHIENKAGRGAMLVAVVLDDDVVSAERGKPALNLGI